MEVSRSRTIDSGESPSPESSNTEGPLPLQARLPANNLTEAYAVFPEAMQQALSEMVKQLEEMYRQEKEKKKDDSRIIVPR